MLHQAFWSSCFASHGDTLENSTQGTVVLKSVHMAYCVMLSQADLLGLPVPSLALAVLSLSAMPYVSQSPSCI